VPASPNCGLAKIQPYGKPSKFLGGGLGVLRVRRKAELEEEARQQQLQLEREERERQQRLEQARIDRVAGSWHEMDGAARYNIATIFDGHGDELLRHKKRMAYTDHDGRVEDIQHGTEFAILVLEGALFGFGICLDFCNRCYHTPYGALDVDFVIVPSCGDHVTMRGHIRTAQDLYNERNTRSFVVQQAYPPLPNAAGFILNPGTDPANLAPDGLIVTVPWSVFRR